MLWGKRVLVTQSDCNTEHLHDMHELVVCLSDSGTHTIDGRRHAFRRGRTFLLPRELPHRVLAPETGAEIVFVCFDQDALLEHTPPELTQSTLALVGRGLYVSGIVESICRENIELAAVLVRELEGVGSLSQSMAGSMLCALLVNHWRSFQLGVEEGSDVSAIAIGRACRTIAEHPAAKVRLDDVAREAGMSRASFTRKFRSCTGMSLVQYVRGVRVKAAMRLLAETSMDIVDVADECGFGNLGYFYRSFRQQTRMTPKVFREEILQRGEPLPLMVESFRAMPTCPR